MGGSGQAVRIEASGPAIGDHRIAGSMGGRLWPHPVFFGFENSKNKVLSTFLAKKNGFAIAANERGSRSIGRFFVLN